MEIETIVERNLAVGYRAPDQGPLHGRITCWAADDTWLRLAGLPLRHWHFVQHKIDDIHDGTEIRWVDVIAVEPDPVHFFNVKYEVHQEQGIQQTAFQQVR